MNDESQPVLLLPSQEQPFPATCLDVPDAPVPIPVSRPRPRRRWLRWLVAGLVSACLVALIVPCVAFLREELPSSAYQAHYLAGLGKSLLFQVEPGPGSGLRYPTDGPYDRRLGYVSLPGFLERLRTLGFDITTQAHWAPRLTQVADYGLFLPYHEKMQAGLLLRDRHGRVLFSTTYPGRVYRTFDDIPLLVLQTLLFIENRELFDMRYPQRNPAVEWDRFGLAVADTMARSVGIDVRRAGGSTLATQLEKFRHSPEGRTGSALEKLRQMGSASLRAYLDGPETLEARRGITLAYMNSMPLAAVPSYGEVHGLGDGLWAWYSADFATVNRLLDQRTLSSDSAPSQEQAAAYRQVLSILLAQRRPAYYLEEGHGDLQKLAESYLRLMTAEGVIPATLRDAALQVQVVQQPYAPTKEATPFASHKTQSSMRARLAHDLGVTNLYDLDRLDLTVSSTLDQTTQQAVTEALYALRKREQARALGLLGERLLGEKDDLSRVVYSVTLYERTPYGQALRVQTDNYDQPLDINEGIRLDLGSSAKLRTLVHYLALVAELHQRYAGQQPRALRALALDRRDRLAQWVVERLQSNPRLSLQEILSAALERRYASGAGEGFFTGGGMHYFANFNAKDDRGMISVREALRDSVNLPYIRIMRDIVHHYLYRPNGIAQQMDLNNKAQRQEYLQHFADKEGQAFLRRFYARYRGKSPEQVLAHVVQRVKASPARLATVYRTLYPAHDLKTFAAFLHAQKPLRGLSGGEIEDLYDKYAPSNFDLHDRGYIARLHPLEMWTAAYLVQHPQASLKEAIAASTAERQMVYRWLFKSNRTQAQNTRIQSLLEMEAFQEIHQVWKRLGYPFETLTPSYATAIGASADRPTALAELVGILLNDGVRTPRVRFDSLHFAAGTPYETLLTRPPTPGERVLPAEVAAAARSAMIDVVEAGTARRLKGAYQGPNHQPLQVGGKTGTGDHRRGSYSAGGQLIGEQVVSRAATFAFFLGDRFFGVVTAYVTGPEAGHYHFTSALPVQVLKGLAPTFTPLLTPAPTPVAKQLVLHTP